MDDINKILTVHSKQMPPKAGCVLVSEPFMQDQYFSRSVVFLTEHEEKGSMGFILNKDTELTINKLDSHIQSDIPVFLGGPVDENRLFFIHQVGDLIPDSIPVKEDVYFGGNWEFISGLIADGILNERNLKILAGFCSWTSGQLEDEILHKSWLVADTEPYLIFDDSKKDLWKSVVSQQEESYKHWLNLPVNPIFN